MELKKAILREIDESGKSLQEVPVQFNPTSLNLKLSNQLEGGRSRSRQTRQYIGTSSTVLTLQLVFDSADEGTTESPVSVQERTKFVERFVLPKEAGAKEVPPKLQFHWGELIFDGIVESLAIDFDHFAADGTPLRAKVDLSMKEQDAEYQALQRGPGANQKGAAKEPNEAGLGSVGTSGGAGALAAAALEGELAVDFAARVGMDPAAWRGLDVDLGAGLSLEAGIEVGFDAGLSVSAGLGASAGLEAGLDVSLEASLGLQAEAGFSAAAGSRVSARASAGFRLSAAGGVDAALQTADVVRSSQASSEARAAFDAPAAPGGSVTSLAVAVGPSRPSQRRTPLTTTGSRTPSQQAAAAPAPKPPRADPRATSFGFGVPLRPRPRIDGTEARRAGGPAIVPSESGRPTDPPWVSLPQRDRGRFKSDQLQKKRRPDKPCGCRCTCKH